MTVVRFESLKDDGYHEVKIAGYVQKREGFPGGLVELRREDA